MYCSVPFLFPFRTLKSSEICLRGSPSLVHTLIYLICPLWRDVFALFQIFCCYKGNTMVDDLVYVRFHVQEG